MIQDLVSDQRTQWVPDNWGNGHIGSRIQLPCARDQFLGFMVPWTPFGSSKPNLGLETIVLHGTLNAYLEKWAAD
uniref:Uncharacterized protein n=1 Tax=Acrobeloides nanus TaxID=290746 RepID=A0A914D111_9BILA